MRATPSSAGSPHSFPSPSHLPTASPLSATYSPLCLSPFSLMREAHFKMGMGGKTLRSQKFLPTEAGEKSTTLPQISFTSTCSFINRCLITQTHCEQIYRSSPVLTQLWSHCRVGCYSSQSFESERQNYAFKDLLGAIMI